ncbi:hypothetical protein [Micromonospora sp. RP3T]|uniref:hypothetical protein n=1 Tax=Micromonospora sp. RP3T TaxID=2135446 RepID=UPI000D15F045|nr:hypothetical protein [Micromonospora sp. RP3T]PTA45161.1 hypothetical protein C8054_16260 [Micromonospora sp. RP3T]
MNGRRLEDYAGGDAWFLVTAPDLRRRLLWTTWTDGGTGEVRAVTVDGPVAAVAAHADKPAFYTTSPLQAATGGGYLAVLTRPALSTRRSRGSDDGGAAGRRGMAASG